MVVRTFIKFRRSINDKRFFDYICFIVGRMKSAVFFSVQNIGTVITCAVFRINIFKGKMSIKLLLMLLLGSATVILFSM